MRQGTESFAQSVDPRRDRHLNKMRTPGPDGFNGKFNQTFKGNINFPQSLPEIRTKYCPTHVMRPAIL